MKYRKEYFSSNLYNALVDGGPVDQPDGPVLVGGGGHLGGQQPDPVVVAALSLQYAADSDSDAGREPDKILA